MMKLSYLSLLKRIVFFEVTLMVVAGGGPLLAARSAHFLGKDVSHVAAGIVGFYPQVAAAELAKVLVVVGMVFFALIWPWAVIAQGYEKRLPRNLCFPAIPLVAYALFVVGTVLKYPSLFLPYLGKLTQFSIYKTAFLVQPEWLWVTSLFLYSLWFPLLIKRNFDEIWTRVFKSRRTFAFLGCFLLAFGVVAYFFFHTDSLKLPFESDTSARFPNVLVVAVDSLRSDRLEKKSIVPSLQELILDPQTVLFRDHYVGVPRTFPSWVELISGASAPQTGVRHMFPGFGSRSRPFSGFVSKLRDSGYATEVWSDFAGDIFPRFVGGFEEIHTPNLTLRTMIRLSVDQSLPFFLPILMAPGLRVFFPALKQSPAFADADHLTSDVIDQLKSGPRPWLKVVFYSGAHFPYAAPHPYYLHSSNPEYQGPFFFEKNPEIGIGERAISEEDKSQIRSLYDGAVQAVDFEIGRLFEELRQRRLWDSTLIIVTADHGEDLYEHDRLQGHGEHLRGENVLKVPLIIKLPGKLQPFRRKIEETTRSIDLSSTILEICGIEAGSSDGKSLLPLITKDIIEAPSRAAYSETGIWFSRTGEGFFQSQRLDYPGISRLLSFDQGYSGEIVLDPRFEKIVITAKHRSLIFEDYKIIYVPTPSGVKYELYNRRKDPENLTNLASTHPVQLQDMRTRLLDTIKRLETKVSIVEDFVVPE